MPTDLNPVQVAIRDHVAERLDAWRLAHSPINTRAGARYRGLDVAFLLRDVLRDVGLRVYSDGWFRGVLVTDAGRRVPREALLTQIRPAFEGCDDAALVATIGTPAFFSALADVMPDYDGPMTMNRRESQRREVPAEHVAYIAEILRDAVDEPLPVADVFEIYLDLCAGDDLPMRPLGRTTFYRIAEETGVVRRVRRRDGAYFLPAVVRTVRKVARFVMSLSHATIEALRHSGVAEPQAYADEIGERIARRADERPEAPGARAEALARALPFPVAFAMASADDPRQALRLVGRLWAERHPETRSAILDAARAYGPDLVAAVMALVAEDLAEEAQP